MDATRTFGRSGEVSVEAGKVRYRDVGVGEPVLFLHGVLVNGGLWRGVVPRLAGRYRCIVPDLPLGGHDVPMRPDADLSPVGLARLVAQLLDAVGVRGAAVVANDTGGAISQVFLSLYPERVSRLVLTNADALGNFPPPLLRPLKWGAAVPGFVYLLGRAGRSRVFRRALFRTVAGTPVEDRVLDRYLAPLARDPGVRRDFRKVLRGSSARYTLEAAKAFPGFDRPVLLAWGTDDRLFFPFRYAEELARRFPDARLLPVPGSRTFVPEDRPGRLAGVISEFLHGGGA
jgi:pimeloyl-ACP methyl ester carboxylesterase